MSEHAIKLASRGQDEGARMALWGRYFHLEVNTVARISWSFLWEAFALASGIPPRTWQTVPGHQVAVVLADENQFLYSSTQHARNDARLEEVAPKGKYQKRAVRHSITTSPEGSHDA